MTEARQVLAAFLPIGSQGRIECQPPHSILCRSVTSSGRACTGEQTEVGKIKVSLGGLYLYLPAWTESHQTGHDTL